MHKLINNITLTKGTGRWALLTYLTQYLFIN